MKPIRLVTHSQRYDRDTEALRRAVRRPLTEGIGLGVLTETYERRHVLDGIQRIRHHSAGDTTVWWADLRHDVLERARATDLTPYRTERGREVERTDVPVVALERRDGLRTVTAAIHLPRGIENVWDQNHHANPTVRAWVAAARRILTTTREVVDEVADRHDAHLRLIAGDWNLDLNRQVNRASLHNLLPGYGFGPNAPGTHGSRRIDGPAVKGGRIARHRVTPTPHISDHDRIVSTIQIGGRP